MEGIPDVGRICLYQWMNQSKTLIVIGSFALEASGQLIGDYI
jgi:hypothetical protein